MKPISTSTYTFSKLIGGGYVYVDKTALIHALAKEESPQYFIARPRRFGKSLLISTLQCLFEGQRELFKGLAIDSLPWDWTPIPVLRLDMGSAQARDGDELRVRLSEMMDAAARAETISFPGELSPAGKFLFLVEALVAKSPTGRIALLVDEYDKPLLGLLGKPEVSGVRDVLKAFYSVIKTTEPLQRFALVTGVSKFSKVSIFSDLNNLTDLTMDARSAKLLGYTHEEVLANFPKHLDALASELGTDRDGAFAKLVQWYDGYHFDAGAPAMFNPVSVGKCLDTRRFKNYWFETGTPTFLMQLLKREPVDVEHLEMPEDAFSVYEPEAPAILPLLVQTGYLTVKDSHREGDIMVYSLGYPNKEVATSFSYHLAATTAAWNGMDMEAFIGSMSRALRTGDAESMVERLKTYFAAIPYDIAITNEKYYQSLFYAAFLLMGARTDAEVRTNNGRIDAVVRVPGYTYVFEFKIRGTSAKTLEQIKERRYYERYLGTGDKVILVGAGFSIKTRNITRPKIEPV